MLASMLLLFVVAPGWAKRDPPPKKTESEEAAEDALPEEIDGLPPFDDLDLDESLPEAGGDSAAGAVGQPAVQDEPGEPYDPALEPNRRDQKKALRAVKHERKAVEKERADVHRPRISPFREDVIRLRNGSVIRGEIVSQTDEAWQIRISGGTILVARPREVLKVSREPRFAHETAHGGQLGLRLAGGFEAGIEIGDEIGTNSGFSSEWALSFAPHNTFEVELGGVTGPTATKATVGLRYYINALSPIKGYAMTSLVVAGQDDPVGLRLANGIQWDWGRHFGMHFHHGATAFLQDTTSSVHLAYHMEFGTQVRF